MQIDAIWENGEVKFDKTLLPPHGRTRLLITVVDGDATDADTGAHAAIPAKLRGHVQELIEQMAAARASVQTLSDHEQLTDKESMRWAAAQMRQARRTEEGRANS